MDSGVPGGVDIVLYQETVTVKINEYICRRNKFVIFSFADLLNGAPLLKERFFDLNFDILGLRSRDAIRTQLFKNNDVVCERDIEFSNALYTKNTTMFAEKAGAFAQEKLLIIFQQQC